MIGDDLVNDVGGAQSCGMKGVQVRTGKYRSVVIQVTGENVSMHFSKYSHISCLPYEKELYLSVLLVYPF